MTELRLLLEKFWITREYEKDLYYMVKRAIPSLRHFMDELAGWRIIVNEKLIKLEKVPVRGESFMGIPTFQEPRDYMLLCGLLIFLEDLDEGEQFLLSELSGMLETFLSDFWEVDWTSFTERKALVRVLRFAEEIHMLVAYEGSSDSLSSGMEHEILYENTGLSPYFAAHFTRDISGMENGSDLENLQSANLDETRGYTRVNRVYRQLTLTPAMYWDTVEDPDSLYLRNQRQWVQKYMEEALGGRLHIHKNAAFFTMEEDDRLGRMHPRDAMLPEVTLLLCSRLRQSIMKGELIRDSADLVYLPTAIFRRLLFRCRKECQSGFSKEFREMDQDKLVLQVAQYMQEWKMMRKVEDGFILYPAVGKFTGAYPQLFMEKYANSEVEYHAK